MKEKLFSSLPVQTFLLVRLLVPAAVLFLRGHYYSSSSADSSCTSCFPKLQNETYVTQLSLQHFDVLVDTSTHYDLKEPETAKWKNHEEDDDEHALLKQKSKQNNIDDGTRQELLNYAELFSSSRSHSTGRDLIIGGTDAPVGSYPWYASIHNSSTTINGISLYILTPTNRFLMQDDSIEPCTSIQPYLIPLMIPFLIYHSYISSCPLSSICE